MLVESLPQALQATFWPGGRIPSDGHIALWGTDDVAEAATVLGLPAGEPASLPVVLPASARARRRVRSVDVPARVTPIRAAVRALAALPLQWPAWLRPGDSVLAWSVAAKLALEHVAAGHLVPALRRAGPGEAVAYWRMATVDDGRVPALAAALPVAAHALRRDEDDGTVWSGPDLLAAFFDAVADGCARAPGPGASTATVVAAKVRRADWRRAWTGALGGDSPVFELPDDTVADDVAKWASPLVSAGAGAGERLCLRLETPRAVAAEEDPQTTWPLAYQLVATDDPSLMVPAEQVWAGQVPMRRNSGDPQEALVRGLAEAARLFPPIDASLSERRPVGLDLTPAQAADFLAHGAAALSAAGLAVLLPSELTAKGARRLRARLRVGQAVTDPGAGITEGGLSGPGLKQFRWEAAIGDDALSAAEFAEIVALKQPLVLWKGQWIRLDADDMPKLVDLVGRGGEMSAVAALSVALAGQYETAEFGSVEVVPDGSMRELVQRLRGADRSREPYLKDIDATLRDYQRRGVAWLQSMAGLGFGRVAGRRHGAGQDAADDRAAVGVGRPIGRIWSSVPRRWSATGSASWPGSPRTCRSSATTARTGRARSRSSNPVRSL